jgi:hypothetical protein
VVATDQATLVKEGVVERHDPELERAERVVLEALEEATDTSYSPRLLVERIKQNNESVSEEAISIALWDLIGRTKVRLTQDWKLERTGSMAAV